MAYLRCDLAPVAGAELDGGNEGKSVASARPLLRASRLFGELSAAASIYWGHFANSAKPLNRCRRLIGSRTLNIAVGARRASGW